MIIRNRLIETELVEQRSLIVVQTSHHRPSPTQNVVRRRNHCSQNPSNRFCNKICQKRLNCLPLRKSLGSRRDAQPRSDQTAIRIKCRHRDRSAEPRSPTLARGQATRGTPFCMDKIRSGGLLLRSASLIAAKRSCSARCQAAPSFRILESVDAPAWLSLPRTPFLKLILLAC